MPRHEKTWQPIKHKFAKTNNLYKEKKAYQKDYDIEKGLYIEPKFIKPKFIKVKF